MDLGSIARRLGALLGGDIHLREVFRGAVFSVLSRVVGIVVSFVSFVVLANNYGASIVGVIAILGSVMNLVSMAGRFGLTWTVVRLIPEYRIKAGERGAYGIYLRVLKLLMVGAGVSLGLYALLLQPLEERLFGTAPFPMQTPLQASVIAVFFISMFVYHTQILRGLKQAALYSVLDLFPRIVFLCLLVVTILWFDDEVAAVYAKIGGHIISALATIVIVLYLFRSHLFGPAAPSARGLDNATLLRLALPMFVTNGLITLIAETDTLMLGLLKSEFEAGLYQVALKVGLFTSMVLQAINLMLAPKISELFHDGQYDALKKVAQGGAKLLFWFTLPMVAVMVRFGPMLLELFGTEFGVGYTALLWITFAQFINAACGVVAIMLNMTGHQKAYTWMTFAAALINVAANYLLIPHFGIEGAAFASFIAMAAWNALGVVYVYRRFGYLIVYRPRKREVR